ncbi:bifunctional molybdenum cofactor guanylyltransferase MobA/molybdopterin-guanine dinucleotide biosynthesis adaptor protein MobB [Chlorobaculum thiosulfatiphilum]|uniref:Probable molybdenum cofactor guanylyltransferase n=1 Tax=Chlorobaculum thiosulfatiphilum TaxID=115852 RepID=A0A5C4S553_CHLTI|nr:bifunctional molybdenum cofactor guanylyltransferase MobA/molybdopterin-guanine dinucleotide biosynthesis adaptor protein MobB [Chlorobaculum thiosulfatiphilum]TNJ38445.1 bifunctional molybdenum cofactor guanylyltransferase MobA/molybdopterin-guanine dinucleotide biosynthesis adaptor protein MobB [Chlorobaculum thiosulfatiphilum]
MFHPFEIALCGLSGSGKTTLMEKLIRRFSDDGFEVAALKHGCHRFEIDREGKDSGRFRQAGAAPVLIADREKEAIVSSGAGRIDFTGSTLAADLFFIEGLKELPTPKLLLIDARREILPPLEAGAIPQALALVHDGNGDGLERFRLPLFHRDDLPAISSFVAEFFSKQAASVPLNGLVLAGGRSSRMGRDKARLRYHDEKQLERTAALLSSVCDKVYISCRSDQLGCYSDSGIPAIADSYLDLGPLGGLLSAQRHSPGAAWLVAACDLPFIDKPVIASLRTGRNPYRFATAFGGDEGRPEPLLAIYEPKSRRRLFERHAAGNDSLCSFLMDSRVRLIEPDEPSKLRNVNDPASMAEARRAIGKGEG